MTEFITKATEENPQRRNIVEEDKVHLEWYTQAREIKTSEELKQFADSLLNNYNHDYGTICHAAAAVAIAGAQTINHSEQGGITGFQAGAIMWEFIRNWMRKTSPIRLLDYENMLYPQYEDDFHSISSHTWQWLQDEAKKNLANVQSHTHTDVSKHWQHIVNGKVPFGYTIKDD